MQPTSYEYIYCLNPGFFPGVDHITHVFPCLPLSEKRDNSPVKVVGNLIFCFSLRNFKPAFLNWSSHALHPAKAAALKSGVRLNTHAKVSKLQELQV